MISIFRNIRKALLAASQTRSYLFYALGEMLLVVSGILIALQINNWNEWRKDRIAEKWVLSKLEENLEKNLLVIDNNINRITNRTRSAQIVLDALESKLPYLDTMDTHFSGSIVRGQMASHIPQNGYEALKNLGFDKLTNQDLLEEIIFLFEEIYREVEEWRNYTNDIAVQDQTLWYRLFRRNENGFRPLNYGSISENDEFMSMMTSVSEFRKINSSLNEKAKNQTNRIRQLIRDELKKTSNMH